MFTALADIKIPKKIKKCGRPKGIDTTVIGLSKHHKSDKPVPFCKVDADTLDYTLNGILI